MFDIFDNVKTYLPKYLSEDDQRRLFSELTQFPDNLDKRFYTSHLKDHSCLFQGDGINDVDAPDYENKQFRKIKGLLIRNTCDVNVENRRHYAPSAVFAPIFNLRKYRELLISKHQDPNSVESHITSVREQKITSYFFLPACEKLNEDSFARFDCLFSLPTLESLNHTFIQNRLFTLSDYGFYILLLKLSIHFSRIQESVSRNNIQKSNQYLLK